MDSTQHTAFTGAPATLSTEAGGAFSLHNGVITGRNLELVADERIVQVWRFGNWAPGVTSIVRFELEPAGTDKTKLTLVHTGVPEERKAAVAEGWVARYWTPLEANLA